MSERRQEFNALQGNGTPGGQNVWKSGRVTARYIEIDVLAGGAVYVRWNSGDMASPLSGLFSIDQHQAVVQLGTRVVYDMGNVLPRQIQMTALDPFSGFIARVNLDVEPILLYRA